MKKDFKKCLDDDIFERLNKVREMESGDDKERELEELIKLVKVKIEIEESDRDQQSKNLDIFFKTLDVILKGSGVILPFVLYNHWLRTCMTFEKDGNIIVSNATKSLTKLFTPMKF